MSQAKNGDEEEHKESEDRKNIISKIANLFSSGIEKDRKEALELCESNFIDPSQFSLYFKPEEENHDVLQFDFEHKSETHRKTVIYAPVNELKKEKYNLKIPSRVEFYFDYSSAQIPKQKEFYSSFPYKKRELLTFPSPSNLVNIINGCFSSYGSREIMQVFNTREFLAKMFGITNLRTMQDKYLREISAGLINNQISIEDAFNSIITQLDSYAYKENNWNKQTEKFNKDHYSTAKNEQRKRIEDIPDIEKAKFIESLFNKPLDSVNNHNYMHKPNYILELSSGTKTSYSDFLLKQLLEKWSNKDTFREALPF